jgi:chromosome partitioning protein
MMQQIITIASHKGGVGKTTTALNLAFSMSRLNPGVLVIDTDPQGALGISGNLKKKNKMGLMDLLMKRATTKEIITYTKDGRMAMVGMGNVDIDELIKFEKAASWGKLKENLKELMSGFSYVIIDAPAGVGSVTRALLSISTGVVMPINSKNTTAKSIPLFLKLIEKIKETENPDLVFEGLLITMFDYSNEHEITIRRDLIKTLPPGILFNSFIILNSKYEEASIKGVPVGILKGGQSTASGYMNFTLELLARQTKRNVSEDDHVEELF